MQSFFEFLVSVINDYHINGLHLFWESFECDIMFTVFAHGPGDLGSIPGRVIPKTLKMVLDASLLNIQVRIKGKVEKSKDRSSALPYTLV